MSKTKKYSKQVQSFIQLGLFIGVVIFLNILANARIGGRPLYTKIDLTEEKRFTLTDATQELIREVDDVVFVRILLDGDLPAGFKRLRTATREMLEDFRGINPYIEYEFDDPNVGTTEQINQRRDDLAKRGIGPTRLRVENADGSSIQYIYPYAIFEYKMRPPVAINLLENEVPGVPQEVVLNNSVSLLEYKLANAVQKLLTATNRPAILFTEGQGELTARQTSDLERSLSAFYDTGRLNLDSIYTISKEAACLIVAKPTRPFSERDKFILDQYVMKGGKVLWLLDYLNVDLDSLYGRGSYLVMPRELNLDDLFFEYGIRLENDLVLDMQCSQIELVVGSMGGAPQFEKFRYPYHPVITSGPDAHPIVRNLGPVNLFYPSSIDTTVRTKTPVRETVLLTSSPYSRYQRSPVEIDFDFLRYDLDPSKFNKPNLAVGVLMEGIFPSFNENRITQSMREMLEQINEPFRKISEETKMIVVTDGDLAKDPVVPGDPSYHPLGYNRFDNYTFANKDFLINCIEYLLDDRGLLNARNRNVKLRLLNTVKAEEERAKWQLINILTPLAFLGLFGFFYNYWRRRKYAS